MSPTVTYRYARNGYTGTLRVIITADGDYGALTPDGMSGAEGNPVGIIDASGYLKLPPNAPYVLPSVTVGDRAPAMHRLTVMKGGNPVASCTFLPILNPGQTVLDINALVASGLAQVASAQDILDLRSAVSAAQQATGDALSLLGGAADAVARMNAVAGAYGGLALLYGGVNPDGSINLIVPQGLTVTTVPYTLPSGRTITLYEADLTPFDTDSGVY